MHRRLLPLLFFAACNWGKNDTENSMGGGADDSGQAGLENDCAILPERHTGDGETDDDGLAIIEINVLEDTRSFQTLIEADDEDILLQLRTLRDPDGNVVLDYDEMIKEPELLTTAFFAFHSSVVFDWPVRQSDGPLEPGTWELEVWSRDGNSGWDESNEAFSWVSYQTADAVHDIGCLDLRVVYADGVDEMAGMTDAVEFGIALMQDIYSENGIEVTVTYDTDDLDPAMTGPGTGDSAYAALKSEGQDHELLLVVGETIDGNGSDLLGEAGGIPGSLNPMDRSAVVVSWLSAAGITGNFDETELLLFGETMAHEIGHYTGLFHPVEFDDNYNPYYFDALEDTPTCANTNTCINQLSSNLMFPYTACDWSGNCDEQQDVSEEQAGVMHRYPAVR